jgi:cell division protein FtsQ
MSRINRPNRSRLSRNKPGRNKSGRPVISQKSGKESDQKFGQKKLVMALVLLTMSVSIWQFVRAEVNDLMPIEDVRIEGKFKNLPLAELEQQVTSVLSGGYFTVDIDAIRNTLLDLPWVENVSVRRQWPSGLHIRVTEKRALAFWGEGSLLSDRGEVFTPASVDHEQYLPQLDGPEGLHQNVWAFLEEINSEIKPMSAEVRRLVLDERRAWSLSLSSNSQDKNIEIKLGRENTSERLARFVRVFSKNVERLSEAGFIDLRYPNGFAMGQTKGEENRLKNARKGQSLDNKSEDKRSTEASRASTRGPVS